MSIYNLLGIKDKTNYVFNLNINLFKNKKLDLKFNSKILKNLKNENKILLELNPIENNKINFSFNSKLKYNFKYTLNYENKDFNFKFLNNDLNKINYSLRYKIKYIDFNNYYKFIIFKDSYFSLNFISYNSFNNPFKEINLFKKASLKLNLEYKLGENNVDILKIKEINFNILTNFCNYNLFFNNNLFKLLIKKQINDNITLFQQYKKGLINKKSKLIFGIKYFNCKNLNISFLIDDNFYMKNILGIKFNDKININLRSNMFINDLKTKKNYYPFNFELNINN